MGVCHIARMLRAATYRSIEEPATAKEALSSRAELGVVLVLACVARLACWPRRPPDMAIYLEPWVRHIVQYGPIEAFAHPFSNYEPAYLYLLALGSLVHGWLAIITIVKLISVAGTIFMVLAMSSLLKSAGARRRGALLLLVLPSVVINDALLGQCDALWAGCCIFGLAAMNRGETARSMLWCGLAISFKAQAAFIAPVMIGAMIHRRAPWWQWPLPALVFVATLVPPWLLGWPAVKLLTVYLDQAALDQLPGQLANPWIVGTLFAENAARGMFLLGYVAAGAAALVIASLAARTRDPKLLILLGALAGTALPFLLPKMLERYYFLGDVLTLALALTWRSRRSDVALRAVQLASILSHLSYIHFSDHPYPALFGAVSAAVGLGAMGLLAAPDFKLLIEAILSKLGLTSPPAGPRDQSISAG